MGFRTCDNTAMPLNIVIPFHAGDAELAVKLLEWIHELGGAKQNRCFLLTDPPSLSGADNWPDQEKLAVIQKLARKSFKSVQQIYTPYRRRRADGSSTWPLGANWAFFSWGFFSAMTQTDPFLWLESDCVPLREGWIKTLEEAYDICGKKMMGPVLDTNLEKENPQYLNGTSIYDARSLICFDKAMIDFLNGVDAAFDLAAASQVMPRACPTRLIQHFFGDHGVVPTFKAEKEEGDPFNVFTLDNLFPEAVIFHRCKDGSLIELLRARRNESKLIAA